MRAITGWSRMLRQTVSIAPPSGVGVTGDKSFGADVSYRCRLVGKRELVRNDRGQEVLSRQRLYLMSGDNVDPQARVTLSTDDVGSTESWAVHPPIASVGRYPADDGGFHHTVVFLE